MKALDSTALRAMGKMWKEEKSDTDIASTMMDVPDLEFIPRAVRDTLDQVAIKLHLAEWQALTMAERQELSDMPSATSEELIRFRERLEALVRQRCGHEVSRTER